MSDGRNSEEKAPDKAPRPAPPPAAPPPPDPHAAAAELCPLCQAPLLAVHCKLFCRNCGYHEDCSDIFPAQG